MIICISGGVGSGKTISATKYIVEGKNRVLTNFKLNNIDTYEQLKRRDVITTKEIDVKGKLVTKPCVNWEFWKTKKGYDVYLDEVHNLISSRNSMSVENRLYSEWLSQIRKLWGQSGDQNYLNFLRRLDNSIFNKLWPVYIRKSRNLVYITQKPRKADINFRELTHVYIQCKKTIIDKTVIIINLIWFGDDNYDAFEMKEMGVKPKIHLFAANKYFNMYNSYDFVSGDNEYL